MFIICVAWKQIHGKKKSGHNYSPSSQWKPVPKGEFLVPEFGLTDLKIWPQENCISTVCGLSLKRRQVTEEEIFQITSIKHGLCLSFPVVSWMSYYSKIHQATQMRWREDRGGTGRNAFLDQMQFWLAQWKGDQQISGQLPCPAMQGWVISGCICIYIYTKQKQPSQNLEISWKRNCSSYL